ncbi:MAG TPA: hypothetical protein ENN56_00150 [Firmicutes bacterium]|nr:hypothetical protein [Bacillota bacterium]
MNDYGGGAFLSADYALRDDLALLLNLGGMFFSGIDGEKNSKPWVYQDWYVYTATIGAKYYPVKGTEQPPFIGAEVGYYRWDGNGSDSAGGGKNKISFTPFIGAETSVGSVGINMKLGYAMMADFQLIQFGVGFQLLNF